MNKRKGFDFERFKEEAMEGLYQGKKWEVINLNARQQTGSKSGRVTCLSE